MQLHRITITIALATLFAISAPIFAENEQGIIAGTSLVREIVDQLGTAPVETRNLLPPNMCPGHYDMRPGDIAAVSACRLLILQPWQRTMPNVASVIGASRISEARIKVVSVPGNWMVPTARIEAARALSDILTQEYPEKKDSIDQALGKLIADTQSVGAELKKKLAEANAGGSKVICNEQQEEFIRWAGIEVVRSYGRPEGLSVAQAGDLTRAARTAGAVLVVDNLQSGETKMGESLARNIGAAHVVLCNFPGGEPDAETWEKTIRKNVEKLVAAITRKRPHGE